MRSRIGFKVEGEGVIAYDKFTFRVVMQYSQLGQFSDIVERESQTNFPFTAIDAGSTGPCGPSRDLIWSFYWYSVFFLT